MSLLLRATKFGDSVDRANDANKDDLMDTSEEKPGESGYFCVCMCCCFFLFFFNYTIFCFYY